MEIKSLAHYIECVGAQLATWQAHSDDVLEPIFRGQAAADWELTPALLRHGPFKKEVEDRLLQEFQQGARPFLEKPPQGRLQWMALAQHHGLPTRLLDWTESALVALFFALHEHEPLDRRRTTLHDAPCVWMLNRNVLHARVRLPKHIILLDAAERDWPSELLALVEGERDGIVVFTPAHITSRMPAQKAAFTLFGRQADLLEEQRTDRGLLTQLLIPRARTSDLRRELAMVGITRSALFPGLDGIACDVWDGELSRRQQEREQQERRARARDATR